MSRSLAFLSLGCAALLLPVAAHAQSSDENLGQSRSSTTVLPPSEVARDRATANQLYDLQRQRDQNRVDQRNQVIADGQAAYQAEVDRRQADYQAALDAHAARVAAQRAEYERRVARCRAGDRAACAPMN